METNKSQAKKIRGTILEWNPEKRKKKKTRAKKY